MLFKIVFWIEKSQQQQQQQQQNRSYDDNQNTGLKNFNWSFKLAFGPYVRKAFIDLPAIIEWVESESLLSE